MSSAGRSRTYDTMALCTRERSRTSNTPGLSRRPLPLGYPGRWDLRQSLVDNLGIEPSRRCLQDSAAHLCVARKPANDSNSPTRRAALGWRWYPRPDSNRHCTAPQTVASYRWATRASAGSDPPGLPDSLARPCQLLPRMDSNHAFGVQSAVSCRWTTRECAGLSRPSPHAGALPAERQPHRRKPGSRTPHVLVPNQARSPSRSFPIAQPSGGFPRPAGLMPSTVEFSTHHTAGTPGSSRGDRARTCNHRFWRPELFLLSYAPGYENAALSGSPGRQARYAGCALRAPPARVRAIGVG